MTGSIRREETPVQDQPPPPQDTTYREIRPSSKPPTSLKFVSTTFPKPVPLKKENIAWEKRKRVCPHCNIAYTLASYRGHIKTHDDYRNKFGCGVCGKTYKNKKGASDHLKQFHPERSDSLVYPNITQVCSYCQGAFPDAQSIKVHRYEDQCTKPTFEDHEKTA